MKRIALALTIALTLLSTAIAEIRVEDWDWVTKAEAIILNFTGTQGRVMHVGDSITATGAYGDWVRWGQGRTTTDNELRDWIHTTESPPNDLWELASNGGTAATGRTTGQAISLIDGWMDTYNPQMCIIMLGTNDANPIPPADTSTVKDNLEQIIKLVLYDNGNTNNPYRGCIPIISTIPPRYDKQSTSDSYNVAIRELAEQYKIPMIDFDGEIVTRRPADWNGSLLNLNDVHPSNPGTPYGSQSNPRLNGGEPLMWCGYLLRTWLSFRKIEDVRQQVVMTTPALSISETLVPANCVTTSNYFGHLYARGGKLPYTWTITAGTIPTGLSFDAESGVLAGTPSTSGSIDLTFRVTDGMGAYAEHTVGSPAAPTDTDNDGLPDSVDLDDDNDGMPDDWELRYAAAGLNPLVSNTPTADYDTDGIPDLWEYVADTDPTDPESFFKIDGLSTTGTVKIVFMSSSNRTYSLEYVSDLRTGTWTQVTTQTNITGAGGVDTLTDPMDADARLYRLRVAVPAP